MTTEPFKLDQLEAIALLLDGIALAVGTPMHRAVRDLLIEEAEVLRVMAESVGQAPPEGLLVAMAGRNLFGRDEAAARMVLNGLQPAQALDALHALMCACEDVIVASRPQP